MNNDQRLSTLFSVVMMLATATLGWFSFKSPGAPRLTDNRISAQVPPDEQDVVARLWEDPLQAVQPETTKNQTPKGAPGASLEKHTVSSLARAVADKARDYQVCLMVVSIPDTPFPDDLETRLRLRYSVQMSLAVHGYAPDNRNYLGYFTLPRLPEGGGIVPYEWFVPRQGGGAETTGPAPDTAVLVLWLPESRLSQTPLDLLVRLQDSLTSGICPDTQFAGTFVIGPQSSDTLKSLVQDAAVSSATRGLGSLKDRLAIFSPYATASDPLIGLKAQPRWANARDDLAKKLHTAICGSPAGFNQPGSWRYFHNFIAPDDELTDLLVAELAIRGLNLDSASSDRILILTEADTTYGRSLPVAFQASLASRECNSHNPTPAGGSFDSETPAIISEYVEVFQPKHPLLLHHRYLRGLDQQKGQPQTGDKASSRAGAKSLEESLTTVLSKQGAMALGESQLDYVDRLVQEIQQQPGQQQAVKAVGVLGGDIYDKLILLRSLRPKFPEAVFFTTDLDARMWHPDHQPFTRNVIVASASDVSETISGNTTAIPPFRDAYQVAVFKACRAALTQAAQGGAAPVRRPDPPAIFELGRDGPVRLISFTSDQIKAATVQHPQFTRKEIRGLALASTGLILTLVLWITNFKADRLAFTPFVCWVGASFCLLVLFCYAARYYFPARPEAEPWAVGEGLSIWPTEILRLFITCTVIAALIWARQHHVWFRTKLKRAYFLWTPPTQDPAPTDPDAGRFSAKALFHEYVQRARPGPRFIRVLLATVAYMSLGFGLVFFVDGDLPPRTHIRGDFARNLDKFFLFLSISSFLALVFYVLDAVLITARLLARISRPTDWPPLLLQKTLREFRVNESDLDGYLDVQFAAEKSEETGRLIYIPFFIQFLFILSRNSYFDNWTWPATLIAIFVGNFFLACAAWGILRHSARSIQASALKALQGALNQALLMCDAGKNRHTDLLRMQKRIEDERRGAYARFFQDPALLAMLLPSGIYGVLTILSRALFGGM